MQQLRERSEGGCTHTTRKDFLREVFGPWLSRGYGSYRWSLPAVHPIVHFLLRQRPGQAH